MMRYHQAHSAWSSRMRNASAAWTNEAIGAQPGRDAGKEGHGTGLGTQQEAQGRVFAGIPLPRFIRCCKNVPMALYCSREVLAEQQLQLRFPGPHAPGLMLPARHRQESLYVWFLAGQFSIYSVATGTVGGSIPRAARHLVDVLLEAVSDRQACTWWTSCSSGRSVRRSDQVRATRIQREPQRGVGAGLARLLLCAGAAHLVDVTLRPRRPAGLPLGARPRAGDWPYLVGQLLQRTAPARRGDQVHTRAGSSSSCSASKPHLVSYSKAKLHHLTI